MSGFFMFRYMGLPLRFAKPSGVYRVMDALCSKWLAKVWRASAGCSASKPMAPRTKPPLNCQKKLDFTMLRMMRSQ
ncbi:hypothetical protein QP162_18790 [Sphingomonas aurantiaca]|uniref:hypothetical protein n=1 Tax=Sphingomonas aurantiaca TaxID=185949 RepID=UPI002FE3FFFD